MSESTKSNWFAYGLSIYEKATDSPSGTWHIATLASRPGAEQLARRIVACVNALEGINPEAVPDLVAALEAVQACPILHDENGHAYLKVPARSLGDPGALVSAALSKATTHPKSMGCIEAESNT